MKRSSNVTCNEKEKQSLYKAINCLVCFFFITQFSSLITHHFKYFTRLAPSLNIFHTICGPHTCHSVQFFFFFPSQYLETQTRKKKEKKKNQWGKKKKKQEHPKTPEITKPRKKGRKALRSPNPGEEIKKRKEKKGRLVKSYGWVMTSGSPCVFNYKNTIKLWVMETENS